MKQASLAVHFYGAWERNPSREKYREEDAASYASFLLRQGIDPFQGRDYLALGGLCFDPIDNYLSAHPHIRKIDLLLDGDSWGRAAAARFEMDLQEKGFHVSIQFPPVGKDWNDTLISSCGTEQI